MVTQTYDVTGMTCGHCEAAVREEVGDIAGVTAVAADHNTGKVEVTAEGTVDDAAVIDAIKEAGYEATPSA